MEPLDDDLLLKVCPKIIGSVATIDELIPPVQRNPSAPARRASPSLVIYNISVSATFLRSRWLLKGTKMNEQITAKERSSLFP